MLDRDRCLRDWRTRASLVARHVQSSFFNMAKITASGRLGLLALHRAARGHGRLVVDQPATEADQDRGTCGPSRPHHHLPAGRGRCHRHDGTRHPRRYPPIASATAMRMIAIHAQTERKRLDRSVRCAEKRRPWARKQRLRGLIRPDPAVCATAGAACGRKSLSSARIQAIFTSNATPLGECRYNCLVLPVRDRVKRQPNAA